MQYRSRNAEQLMQEYQTVSAQYERLKGLNLSLNLARGKPETAQLNLSNDLLDTLDDGDFLCDGVDVRNYGELSGLPSAKRLFADILLCSPDEVIVGGSASLNLMYDVIARAYTHGLKNSVRPWSQEPVVKFLCPYPGYDRHFNLTRSFGAELIPVPQNAQGPDMGMVERLIQDPAVKGMWCVPKFTNPDGFVYPLETCNRIAAMSPAAPDFALMWDNAYCIHTFDGEDAPFPDMLSICREQGHADMVYEFASTSKYTFPGAGLACMAMSVENVKYHLSLMQFATIGYNKVVQLQHVRFLKDRATTLKHLKKHAAILRPKFQLVLDALEKDIAPLGIATWHKPIGGYFIGFNAMEGTAKRTLKLCADAGVAMTPAGATYPGGVDPADSSIRIAPSMPPIADLAKAVEVFTVCVRLAALEKLLGK